ncbi:hypothetical protein B0H10DRAFT_1965861 [Mycena sp. CBHHK59/15]|nr:hypothetical protein B0H10DRAFT_1965861 [Mycena sp. CBHHK59/15]
MIATPLIVLTRLVLLLLGCNSLVGRGEGLNNRMPSIGMGDTRRSRGPGLAIKVCGLRRERRWLATVRPGSLLARRVGALAAFDGSCWGAMRVPLLVVQEFRDGSMGGGSEGAESAVVVRRGAIVQTMMGNHIRGKILSLLSSARRHKIRDATE